MKAKIQFIKSNLMMWLFPLLLIVPNVLLAVTADGPVIFRLTNIILPLGFYILALTFTRRPAIAILLCIPLMALNGFQIILLYLYGGGIIAIDMFLNVVTTSSAEVGELLDNILVSIGLILLLYLPPIIWAIRELAKGRRLGKLPRRYFGKVGWAVTALGLTTLSMCYIGYVDYDAKRELYPLNIACNMAEAFGRTERTNGYLASSASFAYQAKSQHPAGEKEVYVLVIGETSRADNWQLLGYERPTNPLLSKRHDVVAYPKAMSESNTTHKSVPMIMSHLDSRNFGDSVYSSKSILTAFNEAGFATAFFSDQRRNRSFIDFFGEQAQTSRFILNDGDAQLDGELNKRLELYIDTVHADKLFVVLHSYGSHFNYRDRYPEDFAYFEPSDYANASADNREALINAYDNSIRYTDAFLNEVIETLARVGCPSAMVYLSDHGEDIFDDDRERFLHASPTPTYYQLHVPMLVWTSSQFRHDYPDKTAALQAHVYEGVSSTRSAFHTILDLAGIVTPYFDSAASLASHNYMPTPRLYINDYNEGVALANSGIKEEDETMIAKMDQIGNSLMPKIASK